VGVLQLDGSATRRGREGQQLQRRAGAGNYHLQVEAIREALAYFDGNPDVIALDHATEMYLLSRRVLQ
jgi:hypothetical protein